MSNLAVAEPRLALGWAKVGTDLFAAAVMGLLDAELDAPAALPGWTRGHLVAHVASNADALGRLTRWARTGTETAMYASVEKRDRDIAEGSAQPVGELRRWLESSARALAEAWSTLADDAWATKVTTIQGRRIAAEQLPWLRAREVLVHAVDLDTGLTFADLPADFCHALIDDVVGWRTHRADGPALRITSFTDSEVWRIVGAGPVLDVTLPLADVAAWLTGRSIPPSTPEVPRWL